MAALQLDGVNINTLVATDLAAAEAEVISVDFLASKNIIASSINIQSGFHDRRAGSGGAQETSKESWE